MRSSWRTPRRCVSARRRGSAFPSRRSTCGPSRSSVEPPMRRWAQLALSIVALAPAAHAAETALTVELPAVTLTLPRVSPPHFQREGLPYATEQVLGNEILTLLDRQDYEGALARAREKLGPMLAVLETGDPAGLVARSAGPGRLPIGIPPAAGEDVSATVLY